jgi:hypothetical protein
VPGAPLDNNLCEQLLKKSILHRKNSLFYKTEHGAFIGDLFMSLIHTCNLQHINAFEYLTTLQPILGVMSIFLIYAGLPKGHVTLFESHQLI